MTGPDTISSSTWPTPCPVSVPAPDTSNATTAAIANGASTRLSAATPAVALSGIMLLSRPYTPNELARPSAIHGSCPASIVITTTAAAPSPTATHCTTPQPFPEHDDPSNTLTSGLTK